MAITNPGRFDFCVSCGHGSLSSSVIRPPAALLVESMARSPAGGTKGLHTHAVTGSSSCTCVHHAPCLT